MAQERLLSLQRAAGNQAAQRLLVGRIPLGQGATQAPGQLAAPATGSRIGPGTAMQRSAFEREMKAIFGVLTVRTGTLDSQADRLNLLGGPVVPGVPRPGDLLRSLVASGTLTWTAWDPGAASEVYGAIIDGFEEFARSMGGVPPVNEVAFYRVSYETTASQPGLREAPQEGAAYSAGVLAVYESSTLIPARLPVARDQPGAPARRTNPDAFTGVAQTTAHELGHGLVETALTPPAPDAALMRDYQREVGWSGGALYDAGDPAVRQAISSGTRPAGGSPITSSNWNSGNWVEQPISAYMTTAPSEDLPEAVMAYVKTPAVLQARSPRRFAFIEARKGALAPHLRAVSLPRRPAPRPEMGDFPTPTGPDRAA